MSSPIARISLRAEAPSPIRVAPFTGGPTLPSLTLYASVHEKTNLPLVISPVLRQTQRHISHFLMKIAYCLHFLCH